MFPSGAASGAGAQAIPALPSFSSAPSWVNRAGRVDRSACVELRASDLWRHIGRDEWRPARNSAGRQARAHFLLDTWLLQHFRARALPRQLSGDWRTPKSNAMKWSCDPPRRKRKLKIGEQPWTAQPITGPILHGNPNKGAAHEKHFTLPNDAPRRKAEAWPCLGFTPWSQRITVERWQRVPKSNRQITQSPDHQIPKHQHWLICPKCSRKVGKLFLILAKRQELIDAHIAQRWVNMLDAAHQAAHKPMQPELIAARTELLNRYAPLLGERPMLCRHCLGLRYGEVKKSRRKMEPTGGTGILLVQGARTGGTGILPVQVARAKRPRQNDASNLNRQIPKVPPPPLPPPTLAPAPEDFAAFIPSPEELEAMLRAFAIDPPGAPP